MRVVVATPELAGPGGAQSYSLTVAEHLSRLGHEVTLHARVLGDCADRARALGLAVAGSEAELPGDADAVLTGVSRSLALEHAARYPRARRVFVVHGDDLQLPPPVPGAVAASLALNDRTATLAAGCAGAGEVVRLRQPVDLRVFGPRGAPRETPRRVLLFGNYHALPSERATMLKAAWADADLEWRTVGWPEPDPDPRGAIAEADIVVGIGRCVLEAMACGRPAYVHDHAGSDGWMTPGSYAAIEAGGFAISTHRPPPTAAQLRADLDGYDAALGRLGQDLARQHHDARPHAAALVQLFERLEPARLPGDASAARAITLLAEAQLRAETYAERYRIEAKQWAERFQTLHREAEEERIAHHEALRRRDREAAEREGAQAEQAAAARAAADEAQRRLAELTRTRRYRLGAALARPLDRLRRDRPES